MGNAMTQSGIFLIDVIFSLYIYAVMLRFLLQWVKADFYNPVCQFLVKVTNPLLRPLRRFIPGFLGLDLAAIVLMLILQLIKFSLLILIQGGVPEAMIVVIACVDLLKQFVNVFFFAIIIYVVLSWVNPNPYHPVYLLLRQLIEPLIAPVRRIVPFVAGIDFSPLIVLILLQVVLIFIGNII